MMQSKSNMRSARISVMAGTFVLVMIAVVLVTKAGGPAVQKQKKDQKMELGNFSVSLNVKDIHKSKAFYEKLGFEVFGGNIEQNWLIMQNSTATIGLFQGMFENNLMTFNPGWDRSAKTLKDFQDVRDLQSALKSRGITPVTEADTTSSGPASLVIQDPDGNTILIDQHVAKPE